MSCVNIKHPEFIELTKVLDLHPDFLRDIIYEYQNSSPENEVLFPSPEYVREVIQGKSMTDATEKHKEVWETFYKEPKTFKTKEEALKYQTEVNRYFNSESIVIIRTSNGDYKVTVAEPKIKSTTDDIGAFSTTDNNIYYNKQVINILEALRNLKWIEEYHGEESKHGILRYEHGKYYITLGKFFRDSSTENIKNRFKQILQSQGIPVDSFIIKGLKIGNHEDKIIEVRLKEDAISREAQLESYELKERRDVHNSMLKVYSFLQERIPNLGDLHFISRDEATKRGFGPDTNAYTENGEVYIIEGKGNLQIVSEECLHPLINYVQEANPELFNSLLEEAKKTFPRLYAEIEKAYEGESKETRNNELVTQAIARYFAEDFKDPTNTRTFKEKVDSLFSFLADFFNSLFTNRNPIDAKELPNMSLKELAQLLNTSDSTWLSKINKDIQKNKIEEISEKTSIEDIVTNIDEEYMRESSEILDQFDNLYSSNLLSVSELNELCNSVAYYISDLITDIQTKPDFAVSTFGSQYKDIDFSTKSRQEIVKIIGIDNIVKAAKLQFSPATRQDKDLKTISKYRLIQKNWKAIMKKASLELSRLEKFSIYASDKNIDREVLETQEEDNYLTESDIQELEGSTQEHWQIENRTIEIIGSLSQEMRNALLQCYILEKEGIKNGQRTYKKVLNKDGIPKRVKTKDAVYSILRWTQGSITLSDMINKLQSKSKDNPWITQILSRLQDTSGKESDFQSQFFSVFDLHFQSYSSGKKQKSGYSTNIVNENPALRGIISNIKVAYNIGNHLLFKPESIDKENYAKFHTAVEKITKTKYEGANTGELISAIQECLNLLGYSETAENILNALNKSTFNIISFNLSNLDKTIAANLNNKSYNPFDYESENSILGYLNRTLQPFTNRLEDITVQSTYSNGKMYQSYVTPSYMSKLMLKFQQEDDASFDEFIANEYAKYEWFKLNGDTDNLDTGWRVSWLDRLSKDPQARKDFKHTVLLNFDKKYYMKGMSDMDYLMSVLSMYFSHKEKGEESLSWFRVPMLSNKPSSEFIQFYSKRGANYKEAITRDLKKVFDQELSRIQTVMARDYNKDNSKVIKNFDTNGRKFNFLPYMNEYIEGGSKANTTLGKLLRAKLIGEQIDEAALNDLAQKAIYAYMDAKATSIVDTWESNGIAEAAKGIRNIRKDNIRGQLENFIWNDVLASINIMELTITDPAFYANAEDIQKRFAQIHAPGVRGNIEARDYKGERVSDGFERTLYLTDFNDFKSNIIENLKVVFDRKISEAKTEQEIKGLEALKESLLREPTYDAQENLIDAGGDYWNINVADAQAYNSPTSYRKKAFIFGKWSRQKEQLYERLLNGEFNYSDLKEAFQPLKPFKYTQMEKESHVENAPMSKLKVPVQNKNAEYLLVLAGAILQDQDTGKPNLLRAIYKVMEDSTLDDSTKGIDTVQFVSAVKSGEMGAIDIKQFYDDKDGEAKAIAEMKAAIYNVDGTYNNDRVHTTSFEDYCLQQEVPPHFLDHEQIHGSQIRYIVLGDLESTYLGQEVVYNVKDDATGEEQSYTAEEFKAEYEKLISENINDSINELARVLNVTGDTRSRNIALSKILQKEIDSDPRYGVDLMLACSLDEDGNFRIPLGDPIQSKRIEQLINSIIKNRVNKQTIPGGPVVQVSNFGTSRQLNIKFKDRQGNIINREDFNSDVEYRKFLEENQGGVAYYECFAPAYMQEIFTNFTKPDGIIDIETIEELDPELLKMVGYRIPTENKYSIIPMKIVGFLPKEAGEGIMLPNDITLITGSDFDVKFY